MNARERKHTAALVRRRDRLATILDDWQGKAGGEDRARQELSGLDWALGIIQKADENGMLRGLDSMTPQERVTRWRARTVGATGTSDRAGRL